MHAERPPLLRDADKLLQHVGQVILEMLLEFSELIDHDEEVGKGFLDSQLVVLVNVRHLMASQDFLSPRHLTSQSIQRPPRLSPVQVGHDANCVGQVGQRRHGRPPLVVNQNEVDLMWMMINGETCQDAEQELTLARACRPGDQTMWTMSALFEIDDKRPVSLPHTKDGTNLGRHGQSFRPTRLKVEAVEMRRTQELHQTDLLRQITSNLGFGQADRSEQARRLLRKVDAHLIWLEHLRFGFPSQGEPRLAAFLPLDI